MHIASILVSVLLVAAPALVPFDAPESAVRLDRSQHKVDFFRLANQFEGQINRAFCGPASATIVLNALRSDNDRIEKPMDTSTYPSEYASKFPVGITPYFHRYTQQTFLDERTEPVKPKAVILGVQMGAHGKRDGGIQLRQLHALLETKGVSSTLRVVSDGSKDADIKKELMSNLGTVGDYVIVNYSRQTLSQPGGGHISPLAAYDELSDSFLIMDVNPNGMHWAWVPSGLLIAAMRTKDIQENRGYLLIREKSPEK